MIKKVIDKINSKIIYRSIVYVPNETVEKFEKYVFLKGIKNVNVGTRLGFINDKPQTSIKIIDDQKSLFFGKYYAVIFNKTNYKQLLNILEKSYVWKMNRKRFYNLGGQKALELDNE